MIRIIRLIKRYKNQRKIHHCWASNWMIFRMAWIQSKRKYNKKPVIKDIPVGKIEDLD